jgi:hypothetical protein
MTDGFGAAVPDLAAVNAKRRVFVLPAYEVAYISVPKNACTSVKWVMAELAGEDLDRIREGRVGFNPTRAAQVHDRTTWQRMPDVADLEPAVRDRITPEDGWFVFGVLRDPRLRLFSAWQDKYLLRSPGYWEHWDDPAQPPVPRTAEDIIGSFASFVFDVTSTPGHEALDDGHFLSQVHALNLDKVRYSRLYDMSELGGMMADLNGHLAAHGHSGAVTLGRSNKSPFEPAAELFGGGVREAIEGLYADDFAHFGDRWDFSAIEGRHAAWTPDAFAHAQSIVAMNERISDLARSARRLRRQNEKLKTRIAVLREQSPRPGRRGRRTKGPSV